MSLVNSTCERGGRISIAFFRFRQGVDWIFADSVRVVEIINALTLMSFALVFMLGAMELSLVYPYRGFVFATSIWIWSGVLLLGITQWFLLLSTSLRSDRRSAIILAASSVVFFVLSGIFASDYPPLSTAVPIYFINAVMCMFASVRKMTRVKKLTDAQTNEG